MAIFADIKKRYLGVRFGIACMRESGSIAGATALLDHAIHAQEHLTKVLTFSSPELTGEELLRSINEKIFGSDNAPLSLPALFRAQAEHIHTAERAQYNYAASSTAKEDIKSMLRDKNTDNPTDTENLTEEHMEVFADALVDLSLSMGDNCRNLGDALNALASTLDQLPPHIQNMTLKPHIAMIKDHDLVPQELKL